MLINKLTCPKCFFSGPTYGMIFYGLCSCSKYLYPDGTKCSENMFELNSTTIFLTDHITHHKPPTTIFPAQVDQMEDLANAAKKRTDEYNDRKKLMQ